VWQYVQSPLQLQNRFTKLNYARKVHRISHKIVFSDGVARILSTKFEDLGQNPMCLDMHTVAIDNFSLNGNFRTAIIILHARKMERKGWT
jgi:hypothetical protein